MKQQILIIHGGHRSETYQKYLSYLKKSKVNLEDLRFRGWKSNLSNKLGKHYEVLSPKMPNPQRVRYIEWKIWFEKIVPLLHTNVIFIGHSLGGIFLAKYLSEEKYPKRVRGTFLVAAPYFEEKEFKLRKTLEKLSQQGGKIFLYHSRDDQNVTFDHFEKYREALPHAICRIFKNRGHFHEESFPEIVKDIKALPKL